MTQPERAPEQYPRHGESGAAYVIGAANQAHQANQANQAHHANQAQAGPPPATPVPGGPGAVAAAPPDPRLARAQAAPAQPAAQPAPGQVAARPARHAAAGTAAGTTAAAAATSTAATTALAPPPAIPTVVVPDRPPPRDGTVYGSPRDLIEDDFALRGGRLHRLRIGSHTASYATVARLGIPTPGTGMILGADRDRQPVQIRFFRPEPTRIALVGEVWAAHLLAFRALALGAAV